ncbi:conserved Plasmodium protein, unknown function [Plasmodium knowlesi strain H]|uniref:Uncharacterized protein n=3 Tax=Plasmodium knowlesi TaxID=5850 RepID=A0A5K1U6M6_PLAKH|nr:conserved protein, unknown function [Plasmodium knowlesi strain H]OTN68741.1 Uncharacterized protein PKNOH_S01017500 [Plasmodium knowlesi]CAA9986172.1 conserved protein, unknown function [Plasmodium knowlesi strain H]SBO25367.1 conserved Plasmodium protein, unknown function [Plasmodium knowlesi strain H]SBO27666.1 conserved Plasmodium protein, unknown function [Plasmodium knowlesi strain H]VVS75646.1 conserved protein, unknown function [Plasmodium knowlesi strain H]|eukprot:XP_002257583.1 hypothetical protein, conserved in Plasmodium species [Plasmodium knowlesi strain H]
MSATKILLPILFITLILHTHLITGECKYLQNGYTLSRNSHSTTLQTNWKSNSLYLKKSLLTFRRGRQRHVSAFLVFDIIKIFGRLSDQELLGHVISHNNDFIELNKNQKKKKKWQKLFLPKNHTLNFESFKNFLRQAEFEWPLTINTGQIKNQGSISIPVSPIVYVENCRKISEFVKSKNKNKNKVINTGSSVGMNTATGTGTNAAINTGNKINLKIINDYVSEQPISNDAMQCVFSSFSDLPELTKDQFISRIHEWAPSDGIIDWYTFVYNLKEEPSDNIKRFFD